MDKVYKKCTLCSFHKTLEAFPKNYKGLYGRAAICKICSTIKQREYREQNPIKAAANKFKVTEQEIENVWYKTSCDICGMPFGNRRYAIDHCHTTGKIRGLLCSQCNSGLGMFKDSAKL